ncbi:hypothetical protein EG244_07825 [Falsigemmobacter faecalis]|uniref:Hedgehog/Intein (Hint) domain-containing protein n=1 Tax=Falsigemmobacter faecalis TaxID=2488730 RepID=A0A3P3DPH0_9RHOB|nr:hypothetical protein EG244_07825 [Falsigemmobacter faecalis]
MTVPHFCHQSERILHYQGEIICHHRAVTEAEVSFNADLNASLTDAAHIVHVFAADDLFVSAGANHGDGLGEGEAICAGDIYELDSAARLRPLALARPGVSRSPARGQRIAAGSQIGAPGDPVALAGRLVFMAPDGQKAELLLLRCHSGGLSGAASLYVLPLSPLTPRTEYMLLTSEPAPEDLRLADLLCLSFHRGTRVMRADGTAVTVESLRPGERLLTRDHGAQPLRWIGTTTLRARGSFAPVVVPAGTLGNDGELVVGPHQRLFIYQRDRLPGQRKSELLVQARHLVDDEKVYIREGGYAEYFSLVFDRHEIIYAEGIPVESLMVNDATLAAMPAPLRAEVETHLPGLTQEPHFGEAAGEGLIPALQSRLRPAQLPRARAIRPRA